MSEIVDVDMTEERKRKLSSFAPIRPKPGFVYVPKVFREKDENGQYYTPKSEWPVFYMESLTGVGQLYSDPLSVTSDGTIEMSLEKGIVEAVSRGLVSWKNWKDAEGNVIEFTPKKYRIGKRLTEQAMEMIPPPLMIELHNAIYSRSELSEEERQGL